MAARRMLWIGAAAVVALLPLVVVGMAVGVGWVEAFGEWWALGLRLLLLAAAVLWARRQGQRLLPVASAPAVRRTMNALELVWSAQVLAVGVYGLGAQWWIRRTLEVPGERLVLLPWAGRALLLAGVGLLLLGWAAGPRLLTLRRVRHHDVAVQRRRAQAGVLLVWSCFEAAGVLGGLLACGTLSLPPFDLLGGGAIASLLAHRLLWCERLVDLVLHPPLVDEAASR